MTLATLFGKLHEHEMKLMRLNQHEENDKKKKGIALKASSSSIHEENDKEDSNEKNLEEDDDFSLFVKKFNKFLRNKGNFNPKKKGENSSLVPKCYECNQPGHLRFDCPIFKRIWKNLIRKISMIRKKRNHTSIGKIMTWIHQVI